MAVVSLSIVPSVSAAEDEETLPIPERPRNFYIIDQSGQLDERTADAILEKGDSLFAVTGAQVVFIIVAEDDKTDLGELARQTLEFWQLGSYERDNGLVMTISFERGRVSYAVGEGLSQLYTDSVMQELITDNSVGDYFADGKYDRAVLSLYNDIMLTIQEYYDTDVSYWDGNTYVYEAKYEHEFDYKLFIYPAVILLFFVIVIVSAVRHNRKMRDIAGEAEEEYYEDEAEFCCETENIGDIEACEELSEKEDTETPEDSYDTEEGEYNTEEGEYITTVSTDSYYTYPEFGGSGGWKYN